MKTPFGELKTAKQRVLYTLYIGRRKNGSFNLAPWFTGGAWISGGWLPLYALRGPFIGGDSAGRRVRELREAGWPIIDKDHKFEAGKTRNMHIYALGVDPRTLDWDWKRILDEWPNYIPAFNQIDDELQVDIAAEETELPNPATEAITADLRHFFNSNQIPNVKQVQSILDQHLPSMTGGA